MLSVFEGGAPPLCPTPYNLAADALTGEGSRHDKPALVVLQESGAFKWTYTLGTDLLDPWAAGATALILGADVGATRLPDLLRDHGATIFAAAPGVYRAMLRGDWFLTGDTVAMATDGAITYAGSNDDMMNAGGIRVSPLDVEGVLAHYQGLIDCAVTETPDQDRHNGDCGLPYSRGTPG